MKRRYVFYASLACLFLIIGAATSPQAQEGADTEPPWFNEISVEVPQMNDIVDQYSYIKDNLLDPAYKSSGPEREPLFKKSIIALTRLIEHFTQRKYMPTACTAQYQIAESYKQIGDIPRAGEAYRKCATYEQYIKDPPKDAGDTSLMAIIGISRKKLEALR